MNLSTVMQEIGTVLDGVTGLRVTAHPPGSVTPPAGVVGYPDRISYDQTYGRGLDVIEGLTVLLLAGRVTARSARDAVGGWTAGSGPTSVKAALEGHAWTSCDDVHVVAAEFDTLTVAGVDYVAAMFELRIAGSGSS